MLLHDAPEYVIGDMISPFKAVIGGSYKAVEARLLAAIHLRFGLPVKRTDELERMIKTADRGAAYLEATRLAGLQRGRGAAVFRAAAGAVARHRARLPDAVARRNGRKAPSRTVQRAAARVTPPRHARA